MSRKYLFDNLRLATVKWTIALCLFIVVFTLLLQAGIRNIEYLLDYSEPLAPLTDNLNDMDEFKINAGMSGGFFFQPYERTNQFTTNTIMEFCSGEIDFIYGYINIHISGLAPEKSYPLELVSTHEGVASLSEQGETEHLVDTIREATSNHSCELRVMEHSAISRGDVLFYLLAVASGKFGFNYWMQSLLSEDARRVETDALFGTMDETPMYVLHHAKGAHYFIFTRPSTVDETKHLVIWNPKTPARTSVRKLATYIQVGWSACVLLMGSLFVWLNDRNIRRLARTMRDAGQLIGKEKASFDSESLNDLADHLPSRHTVPAIEETRKIFRKLSSLFAEREIWLGEFVHELKNDFLPLFLALERSPHTGEDKRIINRISNKLNNVTAYQNTLFVDPDPTAITEITSLLQTIADEIEDTGGDIFLKQSDVIYVIGRPDDLESALRNLIWNAHHHGGSVKINIRKNENKTRAIIEIRDDGSGIPEDQIETAFLPYARSNQSMVQKTPTVEKKKSIFKGAGLGLTIARNVIESHGGELTIKNRESIGDGVKGLFVRVTLPLEIDVQKELDISDEGLP
ncbi:MAG: HAMP domain-containing sensor histidine kinase [Paracoccaceae bacterium]|nr:HAMP domain-containing sensor histidine kinase [Paracoccaceae bacterium]